MAYSAAPTIRRNIEATKNTQRGAENYPVPLCINLRESLCKIKRSTLNYQPVILLLPGPQQNTAGIDISGGYRRLSLVNPGIIDIDSTLLHQPPRFAS